MTIINVGSTNPVKIEAVREIFHDYGFSSLTINPMNVRSGVSHQPKSLGEIVKGSRNRARNSFLFCDYGIGLESGLMRVPRTKTGYMDLCICTIYDGRYHTGMSCAFEPPIEVVRLAIEQDMDLNEATLKTSLTQSEKIGSAEGIIGLLTKGRVTRKDYTKQAIQMALIHLENAHLYKR